MLGGPSAGAEIRLPESVLSPGRALTEPRVLTKRLFLLQHRVQGGTGVFWRDRCRQRTAGSSLCWLHFTLAGDCLHLLHMGHSPFWILRPPRSLPVPARRAQVRGPAELPQPQHTRAGFGFVRKIMNRHVLVRGVVGTVASTAAKPD